MAPAKAPSWAVAPAHQVKIKSIPQYNHTNTGKLGSSSSLLGSCRFCIDGYYCFFDRYLVTIYLEGKILKVEEAKTLL